MDEPDLKTKSAGGLEKSRGSLFQQYGILLYLLLRRLETPNLLITVEPSEGEDAKFVLVDEATSQQTQIRELVQYKKTESPGNGTDNDKEADDWNEGPIKASALKQWVVKKRPDVSVQDILENHQNTFFTAIVFGRIEQGLKGFIPANLTEYLASYTGFGKQFSKIFPIDYVHRDDPMQSQTNNKLRFGNEDLRKRIRLLRFASPVMLELQCRYILEKLYKIPSGAVPALVDRLLIEIAKREGIKDESKRRLVSSDIDVILAEGRQSKNKWQEATVFLKQQNIVSADPNQGEPPRWTDFANDHYAKLDEFEEAWNGLERNGFIVICGPPGTGKTVLADYLLFRFINNDDQRLAYYLRITSNLSLAAEIEFLKSQIDTDSLFVVDDQHLAFDEVEMLAQTFADYHAIGKARARLVVTSAHTFGKTGRGRRGRETVLSQAILIRLIYGETDKIRNNISEIRSKTGLITPLSDTELVSLSGGNLEVALILARCAQDLKARIPIKTLFESNGLKQAIRDWILLKSGNGASDAFASEMISVFIVGASFLPIPSDFNSSVQTLFDAGFLEQETIGSVTTSDNFFVHNYWLAKLIKTQYESRELNVLSAYIKKYPKLLPLFCERLVETGQGASVLKGIFQEDRDSLVATLNDPLQPVKLDDISKILRSINHADHGGEDARFLRALMSADGSPNLRFFSRFIRPERVQETTSVAVFFNTLHNIDRYVAKEVAANTIKDEQMNLVLQLFAEPDCRLDHIGLCLRAINRCSREFALTLYERLKEPFGTDEGQMTPSSLLAQKILQVRDDPRELHVWVRFCEEIRFVHRRDCYDYLDQYLPKNKLLAALINATEFNQIGPLLLRLHNLYPKMAATILSETVSDNPGLIERLLRNDPKVITLSDDLFVLSRLNKRLAVPVAFQLKEKIQELIKIEEHYNEVASVLNQLSNSISFQLAHEVSKTVNRSVILTDFQRDVHRVSMVGRSLYNIAQVSQELTDWFGQRLNYEDFINDIYTRFVYNYGHLIRGFLAAADPETDRREKLLDHLLNNHNLIKELNRIWLMRCNLTEVGFLLSHLLSIPITISNVMQLIGVDTLGTFRKQILGKFRTENSTLHITNGLFALAKIDVGIATEALDIYIHRLHPESGSTTSRPQRYKKRGRRPRLPEDYRADDLTDLGSLFRVAAAIDTSRAQRLAELIDIDDYVAYASRESNFGRLAVFIQGLHEASRTHALQFVEKIGTKEVWEKQYIENDILDNTIHYARSLGHVSRSKAAEFVRFLLEQDKSRHDLFFLLQIQANLQLISNWLRLLPYGGQTFVSEQIGNLTGFLTSTAEYDTRLPALLAAAEALVACKEFGLAEHFALRAQEQESQMRSINQLHRWIDVFHQTQRIARELNRPDFLSVMFSRYKDWYFFPKLFAPAERQPLLLAYTFHLLHPRNDFDSLRKGILERHDQILNAVREEKRSTIRAISLILARAPIEEINQAAESFEPRYLWEYGLLALTFSHEFPANTNPALVKLETQELDWPMTALQELNDRSSNLEFALTLYLAKVTRVSDELLKEFMIEASKRADDEVVGSTRWLLSWDVNSGKLTSGHHYLWAIIKRTLLRQTYLSWENDLEEAVNNAAFQLRQTRDFQALLA